MATSGRRRRRLAVLLLATFNAIGTCAASFSLLDPPPSSNGYRGVLSENRPAGSPVRLSPALRTSGDELLCSINVVRHHGEVAVPFQVTVTDQEGGMAELTATEELDFEQQNFYSFQVEAVSCSGTYTDRSYVLVQVEDENEYSPHWVKGVVDEEENGRKGLEVKATVQEGKQAKAPILELGAEDRDGGSVNGQVCSYQLESQQQQQQPTAQQLFQMTDRGELLLLQALNYSESHSHVLSVTASDCGGNKSKPVIVVVEVLQQCKLGWKGISSLVTYVPSTGPQPVYPKAEFEACAKEADLDDQEEDKCQLANLRVTATLETSHIGKGCDRDTYSLFSQRRLCGANEEAVDMLPEGNLLQQKNGHVLRDEGHASDSTLTSFDGESGLDAPRTIQDMGDRFPGSKFTIATWMKHAEDPAADKHAKEHITCRADDHKKNRHHMALFVRNCKLVLLLRQEFKQGEENVFRPAEWRWKLPQVCDDEWHHYAVNVDFPRVELVVDGDGWVAEKDNPEIIDDWPLHPVSGVRTRTTVGACWQGSEDDYRHQFKGYLAGLSVVLGANENLEVLRCLHECAESLQIPAASVVANGMEMVSNERGSAVVVDGPTDDDDDSAAASGVQSLVRQIAYLNTREFPAPGQRLLTLSTLATCRDGRQIHLEDRKSSVSVQSVQEPSIEISGTSEIDREYEDFKLGVRIFADVHIVMTTGAQPGDSTNGEPVNGIENRLDSCEVTVTPPLNSDHESFEVPRDLLKSLQVVGTVDQQGAVFRGAEMIYNYERLLRQVTYTNKKPAYYLNRQFKIVCSEMNKRFVSNEYSQTLTVIHPPALQEEENHSDRHQSPSPPRLSPQTQYTPGHAQMILDEQSVEEMGFKQRPFVVERASHNNVVAVVAVVLVGFLAVLLVLGIIRVRSGHGGRGGDQLPQFDVDEEDARHETERTARRAGDAETEMQWDDSALNITVNPIDDATAVGHRATARASAGMLGMSDDIHEDDQLYDEEEDEDEEDDIENEEDEEDDEEEEEYYRQQPVGSVQYEGRGGHGGRKMRPHHPSEAREDQAGATTEGGASTAAAAGCSRLEWDNQDI